MPHHHFHLLHASHVFGVAPSNGKPIPIPSTPTLFACNARVTEKNDIRSCAHTKQRLRYCRLFGPGMSGCLSGKGRERCAVVDEWAQDACGDRGRRDISKDGVIDSALGALIWSR